MEERPYKIMRRSIFVFLQNYGQFALSAALQGLPFCLAVLFSQIILPVFCPSLLQTIFFRLEIIFQGFGFSPLIYTSLFISKLSQTISLYIFTLPFSLTFLLLLKSFVISCMMKEKPSDPPPSFAAVFPTFKHLLPTYICNSIIYVAVTATAFAIMLISFTFIEEIGFFSPSSYIILSAFMAVLYSMILANSFIICNLALTVAGKERTGGLLAILKACALIQGRVSTGLFLALPLNLSMAGLEALFRFRIVNSHEKPEWWAVAMEGLLIAYLYSILLVLDSVVTWNFHKSCEAKAKPNWEECLYSREVEDDDSYGCWKPSQDIIP